MRTSSQKAVNHDLWEKLLSLVEKHKVTFHWVKWHSWHPENERCDELATLALNWADLIEDVWFYNIQQPPLLTESEIGAIKNMSPDKKSKQKILHEGDNCNKCGTPVERKIPKKKKLKPEQKYYYEYFLYCPGCKSNYMVESWKKEL